MLFVTLRLLKLDSLAYAAGFHLTPSRRAFNY